MLLFTRSSYQPSLQTICSSPTWLWYDVYTPAPWQYTLPLVLRGLWRLGLSPVCTVCSDLRVRYFTPCGLLTWRHTCSLILYPWRQWHPAIPLITGAASLVEPLSWRLGLYFSWNYRDWSFVPFVYPLLCSRFRVAFSRESFVHRLNVRDVEFQRTKVWVLHASPQ